MITPIPNFQGITITFNTTEDCNLACKYCYEINKCKKDLSLDYAYKFIDIITDDNFSIGEQIGNNSLGFVEEGIILDFIGGDSLMNVDTVEKIIKYFIYKVNNSNNYLCNIWKNNWKCSISSNGTLFDKPDVRKFLEKWHNVLSLGVSIDGCPEIHDKNRIFKELDKDGKEVGSMSAILKNWAWYKQLFPGDSSSTKSTCAKDSIPYLYDSLVFMHQKLDLHYINQNFIMEDMHLSNEDYILLDEQLEKCVKYVLENRDNLYWSMIAKDTFAKHEAHDATTSKCGSGAMPCLGINGKIYPCFRWAPHTQKAATKDKMVAGDVERGLYNRDAFVAVRVGDQFGTCSKEERCKTCEYSSACSYCIGGCYAEYGDFIRTTHICEVTKLQCKWAKVYWNEYNKLKGLPLEFDEKYTLEKVEKWTPEYIGTNKGF